jgi:hypothetical protein
MMVSSLASLSMVGWRLELEVGVRVGNLDILEFPNKSGKTEKIFSQLIPVS